MADSAFYREHKLQCLELAELSIVPAIKYRLQNLAERYAEKELELENAAHANSPPVAPD
jgi:hypothetical protein